MLLQMTGFHSLYGGIVFHFVYVPYFLYSSINGHLVSFHILAIVNSVAIKHGSAESLWNNDLFSFGYATTRGIAGSCSNNSSLPKCEECIVTFFQTL
jgi:hypothetical protein